MLWLHSGVESVSDKKGTKIEKSPIIRSVTCPECDGKDCEYCNGTGKMVMIYE